MLDIKVIKKDPQAIQKQLRTKDPSIDVMPVCRLYEQICELKAEGESKKAILNATSKEIGEKKRLKLSCDDLIAGTNQLKEAISAIDAQLAALEPSYFDALARLPNLPEDGIHVSLDPKDNVCIKTYGKKPHFSFPFKNHVELNEHLKLFDFKRGAKISGSGWPVYRGMGARLEWALIQWMMNFHIQNGYTPILPPHLVKRETMFASGQLPKFSEQLFKLTDKDFDLFLIPTSEVALNGLHTDEILEGDQLPIQYVSYTPCFRREAGAAGSQERGLIRMHQFNKVEMFCFTTPDHSDVLFHQMVKSAEAILEQLNLHYRSMLLVTGDMSFASAKTVDIEVFLPGQDRYYEVSSVSNCTDYQARRSMTRYRNADHKLEFVHTLNGSGLATSRLMVAILENNQQPDGSVVIPEVLRPYLGGIERIQPTQL
jgi:seryl-tRNA synthetase